MGDLKTHSNLWNPSSWRDFTIRQQPEYKDLQKLEQCLQQIREFPPLVHFEECKKLKMYLNRAIDGKVFILQGGDCAERFVDCNSESIENKYKILLQMSLIIMTKARIPVVKIGRMAGQFAKPRSSPIEKSKSSNLKDGKSEFVYTFKGDNINSFDESQREPDPQRLVLAYFYSSSTLNYLRSMQSSGLSSFSHPEKWNLPHLHSDSLIHYRSELNIKISESLNLLQLFGGNTVTHQFECIFDFFTSHEGLLLNYEEVLTRKYDQTEFFNLSAHFLWIGDRTRFLNEAHVEYFRGIKNAIGVKVGPLMTNSQLIELVKILNHDKEPGRLTLITRYGCDLVEQILPGHISAIKSLDIPVLWICDPCHGNTEFTETGLKTRRFEKILKELLLTFDCHHKCGSHLGGVHLELTGDDVTECIGGILGRELQLSDLTKNYTTFCDPRLNYTQSLDFAFEIAKKLNELQNQDTN